MTEQVQPQPAAGHRSRRLLIVLAFLLLVILAVLLYLLRTELRSEPLQAQNQPAAGIRPVYALLGPGVGNEPFFKRPMAATFGEKGRVYVVDTGNNRVVVFDRDGRYLFQFGELGVAKPGRDGVATWEPGRFNYPTDIAADDHGNVFVADFRNDQIQMFDADGRYIRAFPDRTAVVGKGASGQDGTGIAVTSIAVDADRVYATDQYQVLVFDTSGKLLDQFGKPGSGPTDLDHPNGLAVGPQSMLVISDSNHNRVLSIGPTGRLLWSVGKKAGYASIDKRPELQLPRGSTWMDDGTIVLADALGSRLVRISVTGEILGMYGERGGAPGELNFPTDVASQGDLLVIAEKGGDRVQVVRLEDE